MDFYPGEEPLNLLAALSCLSAVYFQGLGQSLGGNKALVSGPHAELTP